jgi:hypothetical protein
MSRVHVTESSRIDIRDGIACTHEGAAAPGRLVRSTRREAGLVEGSNPRACMRLPAPQALRPT